jgi:hypothetical protein
MDLRRKLAALLESEGIGKSGRKNRLIAALSQMMESMDQPVPDLGSRVPAVAVGVLRAEEPKDESQWRCKVPTCSGSYHPLIKCLPFLQMPAEERGELVALSDLCRGCLTPGHGTTVQACPLRDELDGPCAKPKCKRAHHQLLHVDGKQSRCPHQYLRGDAAASKQRYAQAAVAATRTVHQPPVQLVTQRIKKAAGKSCLAFWDNRSQVTLTTHKAAREMGLEPIPGPPLNLTGVGDSQKTRSTVRYKVPLVNTRGRTVEVAAYGKDHIMAPLEAVSPAWMRAAFPEAPTRGLEAACGRVDLLIGQDNLRLFPVEYKRVENAALHRSFFGTGWIASGRPPGPGDPATGAEMATGAGMRTSAEEAASKEEAVNEGKPAHTATMDKPAKPPDRLGEQFTVIGTVCVQKPEEPVELQEPEEREEPEEDPAWDEWPPDGNNRPLPSHEDRSRRCGAENAAEEDAVTALLEEEARENCEPEPRRIVLTLENIAARGKSTRAILEKQADVEEPRGMQRAREDGTAAEADTVGVRRGAVRFAEDAKMDPSNCLMETLVLRENQEGIRIRRSPGDCAKHLPWVLERVFLQTSCGPCSGEQGRCASSDVRGNSGRCVSGNAPGSRDQYVRGNAGGDRSRCASSQVRGNGG